ncbi:MAG: hypothetical protein K5770_19865 [Lachnospiraceae bacterium]|nr:hypothetical protein [Lachnospiraceae bacterium]
MNKKRIGQIIDIMMYTLLVIQMLYIFTGNNAHEILGILFFICMGIHMVLKRWWFGTILKSGKSGSRRFFDIVTCLLILTIILLMLSSMGVSRFIFPSIHILGIPTLHRLLATATLTLSVLHGGMHGIWHAKNKRLAVALVILACILSTVFGIFLVPYMNRHFRRVEISYDDKVKGDKVKWNGEKPLVVYFTRVGNTDFDPDVDAVSGASLLVADGEMMGSNRLLADMVCDILDCDSAAITLTGKRYPSSYNATVSVAGDELRSKARPAVEKIDVSGYDSVILIYPLWWGSIPMPVASFLEQNDFSGKKLYLITTQGSSGYGNTVSEIEELCPGATVIPGTSIYCEDITDAREELFKVIGQWK